MPHASSVAETGGATVAITSAVIGYTNDTMGWLNHNSAGMLVIFGAIGAITTVLGHLEKRKHLHLLVENELRHKQDRKRVGLAERRRR